MSRERVFRLAALWVAVFLVYLATGIGTSGDSRWSIPIALSMLREGNTDLDGKSDHIISVPATGEFVTPIVLAIPLQLLAYHIALLRGCDVDQPRNLAKSVTVE